MADILKSRVAETTTTTGTGAITLAGAITSYRRFSAVCNTGDTTDYVIYAVDENNVQTGEWEEGVGTYSSANTLTRTTPKAGSSSTPVNFSAGTKIVVMTPTADRLASIPNGITTAATAARTWTLPDKSGTVAMTSDIPATTDELAEGSTNLYSTAARIRGTVLTGLSTAAGTVVTATHTVLEAIGLLQKQVSDAVTSIAGKQDTLVSGTNIKTVNGTPLLGSGDVTISGGGSPGGSTTQVQFNDAGAFAGDSGLTYNKTTKALTFGPNSASVNTSTATDASAQNYFDIKSGANWQDVAIRFYQGTTLRTSFTRYAGNELTVSDSVGFAVDPGLSYPSFAVKNNYTAIAAAAPIRWSSIGQAINTADVGVARDAAGVLKVTDGATTNLRDLKLRNLISSGGVVQHASFTVSTLPSASTSGAGAQAFVTDANATTPRSTVAGGGSNKVNVFSDGTNWLIAA